MKIAQNETPDSNFIGLAPEIANKDMRAANMQNANDWQIDVSNANTDTGRLKAGTLGMMSFKLMRKMRRNKYFVKFLFF